MGRVRNYIFRSHAGKMCHQASMVINLKGIASLDFPLNHYACTDVYHNQNSIHASLLRFFDQCTKHTASSTLLILHNIKTKLPVRWTGLPIEIIYQEFVLGMLKKFKKKNQLTGKVPILMLVKIYGTSSILFVSISSQLPMCHMKNVFVT